MHTKPLSALATALALCAAPLASAQQPQQRRSVIVRTQQEGAAPVITIDGEVIQTPAMPPLPPLPPFPASGFDPHTFSFISSEMSFDTRTVKGAPYTAEAVTEITQTLADGNRIVRRTAAQYARDSEGRTRREATVNLIGNVGSASNSTPVTVFINDPVAKVNYVLNERDRTARKLQAFKINDFVDARRTELLRDRAHDKPGITSVVMDAMNHVRLIKRNKDGESQITEITGGEFAGGVGVAEGDKSNKSNVAGLGGSQAASGERRVRIFTTKNGQTTTQEITGQEAEKKLAELKLNEYLVRAPRVNPNVNTEQLGKQIVEGVEAEGTRTTTTIEAGKIGNERPIVITSERWYSPELQTVVMTRRSDPRQGETTYKLTNINRAEPARSLFEVPADYTIKESPVNATRSFRFAMPKTDGQ